MTDEPHDRRTLRRDVKPPRLSRPSPSAGVGGGVSVSSSAGSFFSTATAAAAGRNFDSPAVIDLTSPTEPSFTVRRRTSHDVKAEAGAYYDSRGHAHARGREGRKRRLKRLVGYTALVGLGWLAVSRLAGDEGLAAAVARGKERVGQLAGREGVCEFVSPLEAYQRDLVRLRRRVHGEIDESGIGKWAVPLSINTSSDNWAHPHRLSSTGHLIVSPDPTAPHPIPLLLARGEQQWTELVARQSRTLGQAVREYERRYGRKPPRGFDVWWRAVEENKLVLPDEYDRINLDLAPFFALPKGEMRRRMEMVREMRETFTVAVKDGKVSVKIHDEGGLSWEGTMPRAKDAGRLINAFAQHLPDLNATFSIFDQPQIYLSWARRGSLVSLGLQGQHTQHLDETDDGNVQLSRSCPPDSNLRVNPDLREGQSFIYDSLAASDLCQNPYIVPLHGLTIEPHTPESHPRPHTQLLPLFSLAKTSINSDILITPLEQFFDKPGKDPSWANKRSSRLAWRGSPTGISMMDHTLPWRDAHRFRLHWFANNHQEGDVRIAAPDLGQYAGDEEDDEGQGDGDEGAGGEAGPSRGAAGLGQAREKASRTAASNFYLDTKLSGKPIQCDEEDGTCDDMVLEVDWARFQPSHALNRHKYLMDIDGNGWRRLMSTNSLVIKMGIFTEWFQPHLIPWFMYVPARLDFTDLYDILAFFRGTPHHPTLGFDETAQALARNGQCFVKRMYRLEDLQAYMMRLFLEYARLVADEGEDMDFDYERYMSEMPRRRR